MYGIDWGVQKKSEGIFQEILTLNYYTVDKMGVLL